MSKSLVLLIFIFTVIAQLSVPASIIYKKNNTLHSGKMFRFKTKPIDPADPFVGRYVDLSFDQDTISVHNPKDYKADEIIYLEIIQGIDSFAIIKAISSAPFNHTSNYIQAKIGSIAEQYVYINYPFTRFYMEESKAPEAEIYANTMARDTLNFCYAEVMVLRGDAVLKDIKINNKTIKAL